MIELKPNIENHFTCPKCGSETPDILDVCFQTIYVLADCRCSVCSYSFFQTFPTGHVVDNPIFIDKANSEVHCKEDTPDWLCKVVDNAHANCRQTPVTIRKIVFEERNDVVILNTLDYLYGHVLLKLYNAQFHLERNKDLGLIVIVPKIFEWMIPKGCAEAWVVDLKLNELCFEHESIAQFVRDQFKRFRSVYLSKAYSHPDFTAVKISRFVGVKPFNLADYTIRKPTITFILREDRWWYGNIVDYWIYRFGRRFKRFSWAAQILAHRQNKLVKETIHHVRCVIGDCDFYITGLGRTGNFGRAGIDERKNKLDASTEKEWCAIYARSHVVVGVHGSNMLLPTALSAGCVEILPEDRFGNMVQDISVRYNDRKQLFLYRFADQYSSPRSVAKKVISMLRDFDTYNKNMCENLYAGSNAPESIDTLVP
jgi:hypothetical protein